MAKLNLQVSFTFPYRWLTEEREFLSKRLIESANRGQVKSIFSDILVDNVSSLYGVRLKYHAYQPVPIPLTKAQIEKLLKPMFPGGKCLTFETFFVQETSRSMLPVMEFEIYY